MPWWVIAKWEGHGGLDSARRLLEKMGSRVEREYLVGKKKAETVWADLLAEAEALGSRPSILVACEKEVLDQHADLTLNQCRRQRIEVFSLGRMSCLESGEMEEMLEKLAQEGHPSWQNALSWWMRHNDMTEQHAQDHYKICEWQRFQRLLRGARIRRRIEPGGGKRSGRPAFGDKPEERAVVERILALDRQQQNLTQIASTINGEGHRTLTGKLFRPQTVKNYVQRYGSDS